MSDDNPLTGSATDAPSPSAPASADDAQARSLPITSLPTDLTAGSESDLSPAKDDNILRILDAIKSQNHDQLSFQRSTHDLIVDLSSRVKNITDDASARAQRAMLVELVMLHDSLDQAQAWIRNSDPVPMKETILDRLDTLRIELLEILMRREVRPYDGEHHVLDRRLHRTIRTLPTSDPSRNDRVERVVRPGFFWREQVLRPEEVVIFKHRPELPDQTEEKS
jgi:molecular chaperone GrpE (heat shock protein)